MSQENQITLRGYVTAEPQLRYTRATATPVADVRVGCTPRRLNRETGEWEELSTTYYTIKVWRRLAVNVASSLHKGDMVVVRGRFHQRQWVDDAQRPRISIEIEADSLGHDLSYGWSHFMRGSRPQPEGPAALNAGEAARQDLGPTSADDQFPPLSDHEYPGGEWAAAETAVVTDSEHERFGSLSLPDQSPGSDEGAQPEPAAVAF
jgi:single-strand DNA-binding protein